MGPRSSDRGYDNSTGIDPERRDGLQWVHGPQTVVMFARNWRPIRMAMLQWVHGPQTVVMRELPLVEWVEDALQWVHGPQTVVMPCRGHRLFRRSPRFNGSTVLRPWLCRGRRRNDPAARQLQWVHGPQTVVMLTMDASPVPRPRSFNGSTVLRPWLCVRVRWRLSDWIGFNGSTVLRPWLWLMAGKRMGQLYRASMGPRSSDRGYGGDDEMPRRGARRRFNGSTVLRPWL